MPRKVPLGGGREMLDSMRNNELRAFLKRADRQGLQVAAEVGYVKDYGAFTEWQRAMRGKGPRPRVRTAHLRAFNPDNFLSDADALTEGDIRELIADTLADAHAYMPAGFVVVSIQMYSGDTGELAPYSGERVA